MIHTTVYRENFRASSQARVEVANLLLSTSFRIVLILASLVLLVLYVAHLSTASVKGYDISALEKQVKTLQEENSKLEFEIAKLGSMQNIQERLRSIQFVQVEKPEFALIQSPIIAQR